MPLLFAAIEDEGERTKLEQIYGAYADAMYYVAYRILNNERDAEDAVHSAFVKIMRHTGRLQEPVSDRTRSFVLIVTEHTAIDMYRRNKRQSPQSLDEEAGAVRSYDSDGADGLTEMILKLPERSREVLLLKYVHGYTYAEIGALLHVTEENAKKIGQRAKAALENRCREEGLL